MTTLTELVAQDAGRRRELEAAELRLEVIEALHDALRHSELSKTELAERLGVRRSAVTQVFNGTGNLRITTLAEYLHAMGYRATLGVERRSDADEFRTDQRPARPVRSGRPRLTDGATGTYKAAAGA